MNLKVLLVDDHEMMRRGMRESLSRRPGLVIAGEASTGAMALQKAGELQPDVVFMDIHLPT